MALAAQTAAKPQSTKDECLAAIGSLDNFQLFHNHILVVTWIKSNITASGIILTDKTRDEDIYQSKIGLVVKKGPNAFVSDASHDFGEQDVSVGDWAVYRVSDGFAIDVNGSHCRLIEDQDVKMTVTDPLLIY